MTVALLPAYGPYVPHLPPHEPLDAAPNFVRSREATRWHRPRSGFRHADGRTVYSYWCGGQPSGAFGAIGVDAVPEADPLCATCEGRFEAQQANRLMFTPIKGLRPRQCPASRSCYWVPADYRRGWFACPVCGENVSARAPWHSIARVSPHAPGAALVAPCRLHGWGHLTLAEGRVVCECAIEAVAS
jgi:hypothetical protein